MKNKKKQARIHLMDADGFARNNGPAIVVLLIDRDHIERFETGSVLERLYVLTDNAENFTRYRESLMIQVSGYDHDPRELPEIPEVRRFFAELNAKWPFWLWFLMRNTRIISLLLALLCKVKIHKGPAGSYGTEFLDPAELNHAIIDMAERSNHTAKSFNVSQKELDLSFDAALNDIYQ